MVTSKQLKRLATNPTDYVRFMATGQLPDTVRPTSPLIDLLLRLSPRDRIAIVGLTVDSSLGYSGSRIFGNAEQALRWIRPEAEMLRSESYPARSWQDKRFTGPITLDTLLEKASSYPASLRRGYPQLCARPARLAPQISNQEGATPNP